MNSSVPSSVRILTREGQAAGIITTTGSVQGAGEDGSTNIPDPPGGVTRIIWETD